MEAFHYFPSLRGFFGCFACRSGNFRVFRVFGCVGFGVEVLRVVGVSRRGFCIFLVLRFRGYDTS